MENKIILNCRHCNQKNRVDVETALYKTDEAFCGKCKKPIFLEKGEAMEHLNPADFIHPLDKSALDTIKKIPAITSILKFLVGNTQEKFFKMVHYQNFIKVSENQFPKLYVLYKEMLTALNMKVEPELFVYKSPYINAYTYGVDKHFIAISSTALEELTDIQIQDILAHELGHVLLDHVLYKMAARVIIGLSFPLTGKALAWGGTLLRPIRYALLAWSRASELSADRIAVLATRRLKDAHLTTLKLAGGISTYKDEDYNFKDFIDQSKIAREIEDASILTKIYNFFENHQTTHPFPVWRAGELDDWAKNGAYLKVISNNYETEKSLISELQFCTNCNNEYSTRLTVCPYCGHTEAKEDKSFFDKIKDFF